MFRVPMPVEVNMESDSDSSVWPRGDPLGSPDPSQPCACLQLLPIVFGLRCWPDMLWNGEIVLMLTRGGGINCFFGLGGKYIG